MHHGLKVGPLFFLKVHKVIPGTLADRDGRIQKGDRVLSINGKSTKGVTHREALSILKVRIAKNVFKEFPTANSRCNTITMISWDGVLDPSSDWLASSMNAYSS